MNSRHSALALTALLFATSSVLATDYYPEIRRACNYAGGPTRLIP